MKFQEDHAVIEHEEQLSSKELLKVVKESGYRASTQPFERKTFKERYRHAKENKNLYLTEFKAMYYSITLFLVLAALSAIGYFGFFQFIPDFLANYGLWIFYLILSVAVVSAAAWHYYTYDVKITCMVGMMVGMTFGMQTGMLIGAVLGATNGFFVGSLGGMLIGTIIGLVAGKCCGIMGVMEGMMAGVMGGTMGPMITVMMFSDHIQIFMPFYVVINILIIAGLTYMLFEESVEGKNVKRRNISFGTLASVAVLVTIVLVAIMVYGPKNPLLGF